ncbi:MAG: hypothetical protein Q9M92_14600 [Enterobacterales bacterium]|nr:hypothetical protein [Enterobacterales bacterium]
MKIIIKLGLNSNHPLIILFNALLLVFCLVYIPQGKAEIAPSKWQLLTQPIYKSDEKKELVGNGWLIVTEQDNVRLSFWLEISKNGQLGRWLGELRTSINIEGFDFSYLAVDNKKNKLPHERATTQPSLLVAQGNTGESIKIYRFTFPIEWDGIAKLLDAQSIDLRYRTFEHPKVVSHQLISTSGLKSKLKELLQTIKSNPATRFYVLSRKEIESIVIEQLPAVFKQKVFSKIRMKLGGTMDRVKLSDQEVNNRSFNQVMELIEVRLQSWNNKTKKAHKAIYDQEPNWMDMNLCPKSDLNYCHNIGRQGVVKNQSSMHRMLGMEVHNYGKIRGVIWRSKNSIVKITGGRVDFSQEPKIIRADTGGYYYLFSDKQGRVNEVIHVDNIKVL